MTEDVFHLGLKALLLGPGSKVLLLQVDTSKYRSRLDPFWDIPGGRIQRGESLREALLREVSEETGIDDLPEPEKLDVVLANNRIPGEVPGEDFGLLLGIYIFRLSEFPEIKLSAEHLDSKWFEISQARELLAVKYPQEFTHKLGLLT